ncbi:MAG TPA: RDD family protein [Myxococcales bacterium]|nr:RDD family protein [Myxococcales bacterium]
MSRRAIVQSPEHVLIELVPAGLGARLAAFLLDMALIAGILQLIALVAVALPQALRDIAVVTASFVVIWGYNTFFEVRWNGQTPGKRILRIRVVDGRGLPVDTPQSLIRNVVRLLDLFPAGGVGALAALLDGRNRRLGDLAADTLVVVETQPALPAIEALAARRFNSLRTPRVRRYVEHRIGIEERELLFTVCLRAPGLSDRARFELFEQLGAHYRAELGIDDPNLSGESLVRGLAAMCAGGKEEPAQAAKST